MNSKAEKEKLIIKMSGLQGVYIGSAVFGILGVVGCIIANFVVGRKSPDRLSKFENRSLACIIVSMATFCMWLQWVCAYMHQLNPITPPVPEAAEH